jgi:hypothetical protein
VPPARILCKEYEPNVSADDQKRRRHSIATVDGLVSVTQQAWGLSTSLGNELSDLNR